MAILNAQKRMAGLGLFGDWSFNNHIYKISLYSRVLNLFRVFQIRTVATYIISYRERNRRGKAYLRCTQPTSLLIN